MKIKKYCFNLERSLKHNENSNIDELNLFITKHLKINYICKNWYTY